MDIQPSDLPPLQPSFPKQPRDRVVIQNELNALKDTQNEKPLLRDTHSIHPQLLNGKTVFLSKVLECLNKIGQKTGNELLKTYTDHPEEGETSANIEAATKNAWNQLRHLGLG